MMARLTNFELLAVVEAVEKAQPREPSRDLLTALEKLRKVLAWRESTPVERARIVR